MPGGCALERVSIPHRGSGPGKLMRPPGPDAPTFGLKLCPCKPAPSPWGIGRSELPAPWGLAGPPRPGVGLPPGAPRSTRVLRRADSPVCKTGLSYRIRTWRKTDWRWRRAQAEAPFLKQARVPCTITPRSHAHYREADGCGPWRPMCGEPGAKLGSGPKAGISLTQHSTSWMGPPVPLYNVRLGEPRVSGFTLGPNGCAESGPPPIPTQEQARASPQHLRHRLPL